MKAQNLYRLVPALALVLLSTAGVAPARGRDRVEVGFPLASVSALDDAYSDTIWLISAPSGGLLYGWTTPGLYAAFELGDQVSFEPQLGVTHFRRADDSSTLLSAAAQLNLSARSWRERAPYLFGRAGLLLVSEDGESDTQGVFGVGFGYRVPIRSHAVVRWEGFYNRLVDAKTNEFGARVKLGILF
jgi:hypothetical protein